MARKQSGRVRLFTRRGYDWTDLISDDPGRGGLPAAAIGGEAVYCDDAGTAIFGIGRILKRES